MIRWKEFLCAGVVLGALGIAGVAGEGADRKDLPKPKETAGKDLLEALRGRRSTRSFEAGKAIPDDILATVLWAADGVNRPNGKHTSPCAVGARYMRIYVCLASGAYRYDQDAHALIEVSKDDLRPGIGRQKFFATAPAVLVLASDLAVLKRFPLASRREMSHATAGCIAQNVYLAAEAFGLGTVMAAGMKADAVRKGLSLAKEEVPLYIMPLGYPKAE